MLNYNTTIISNKHTEISTVKQSNTTKVTGITLLILGNLQMRNAQVQRIANLQR